jgi:hypothetical protein
VKDYLSAAFKRAANASASGDAILSLLTISHPDLAQPIRLVYNNVPIVSRGNTFSPCIFSLGRPKDAEDDSPQTSFSVDNVDQTVGDAIDSIATPPTALWETIMASAPGTVEESLSFELQDARYNGSTVTATLGLDRLDKETYPKDSITPNNDPGVF